MKVITADGTYKSSDAYVIDVDMEVTKINFIHQIDDLLISSPEGDVLIAWDLGEIEFDENKSMLIKPFDNLKELNNLKSTAIFLRQDKDLGKSVRVFITAQRN